MKFFSGVLIVLQIFFMVDAQMRESTWGEISVGSRLEIE